MPSVAVLAADGFETIECLTMVDVMRRGGVRATLVSIMPTREVVSSLQIPVTCDALFDEINFDEYDCVVLPGGLPGATNLRADQRVLRLARLGVGNGGLAFEHLINALSGHIGARQHDGEHADHKEAHDDDHGVGDERDEVAGL